MSEMFMRDSGDVIDRFTISLLKKNRIGTPETQKEYEFFLSLIERIKTKIPHFEEFNEMLLSINSSIWSLESALKGNREMLPNSNCLDDKTNNDILAQIGKNTILIRNFNHLRVKMKNIINLLANEGFIDIKQDHLSE
jgi:hypothetical protein